MVIKLRDRLDVIRRNPAMFLPNGKVTLAAIGDALAGDAADLGARHVHNESVEGWQVVSADVDWLVLPPGREEPLSRLFEGLHAFPLRVNGMRAEALVGAFCSAAYISTPRQTLCVLGALPLPAVVASALCPNECIRSVAFTAHGS